MASQSQSTGEARAQQQNSFEFFEDAASRELAERVMGEFSGLARDVLDLIPYVTTSPKGAVLARRPALVIAEITPVAERAVTIQDIVGMVAAREGISEELLCSKERRVVLSGARQLVMKLATEATSLSSTQIGKQFGCRDHTTILHGVKGAEERSRVDPQYSTVMSGLLRRAMQPVQEPVGQPYAILLSDNGLEAVDRHVVDEAYVSALKLQPGEVIFTQPSVSATPAQTEELWRDYGQIAADVLSSAIRG